jgi:hypothetical protein
MPPRTKRRVVLHVRITEDIKDLLDNLADDNDRTLSAVTQIILEKGLGLDPIQSLYLRVEE